jgi:hypothetical protein
VKISVEIAARLIDWCGVLKFTELTVAELFKTSIDISSSTCLSEGCKIVSVFEVWTKPKQNKTRGLTSHGNCAVKS